MPDNCNGLVTPAISPAGFYCDFHYIICEEPIDLAGRILDGEMTVAFGLPSIDSTNLSDIWDGDYSESPNTFRLYLMSLSCIIPLSLAYAKTNENKYSEYAYDIVKSWNDYRVKNPSGSYIWYDHSVAMRTEHLVYFYTLCYKSLNEEKCKFVLNLINENALWLLDDKNYFYRHNHGIIEDESLLYAAYFYGTDKNVWIDKAIERLKGQMEYAFNDEGIHVENSTNYQIGIMRVLLSVKKLLADHNDNFSNVIGNVIKKSANFMMHITKPNGHRPMIGDSIDAEKGLEINYESAEFGDDEYAYSATLGESGTAPQITSKCFYSGYYISRSSWDKQGYTDNTWKCFKSGYASKTHKHADDNSVLLYAKGYDVLVDPGFYNYMPGDPFSSYFKSSSAHNTLVVDERNYSVTEANCSKCGIYDFVEAENYRYVLGFNNQYPGVRWDRHFYDLGDAILIYDDIDSESVHSYSQFFHLSEHMNLVECSENEYVFRIADTDYYVCIHQYGDVENHLFKGGTSDQRYGYISKSFNALQSIYSIKSVQTGKSSFFLTLIKIEDSNGNIKGIRDILYRSDDNRFDITGIESNFSINLIKRKREEARKVSVCIESDNTVSFRNYSDADGSAYCWYVVDEATADVIFKSDWSHDRDFIYDFNEKGSYYVKAYIKSENNRFRDSYMVACIDTTSGKAIDVTSEKGSMNLIYNGHHCERISGCRYKFIVDFEYAWKKSIAWYVYKNGAFFDCKRTEENYLEYEFNEPGKYSVMYYLKTINGDNEFWSFDSIDLTDLSYD